MGVKVVFSVEEIERILDIAKKILSKRAGAFDITSALLISVADGKVVVKATDLKNFITIQSNAEADGEGVMGISFTHLRTVLKDNEADEVVVESTSSGAVLTAGKVKIRVSVVDGSAFPRFPEMPPETYMIRIKPSFFSEVMSRVKPFADKKGGSLGVVHFELEDEGTTAAVATDGFKLAVYRETTVDWEEGIKMFTVRVEPLEVLHSTIKDWEATYDIEILVSDSRQALKYGPVTIITDPPTSAFPNWRRVFPKEATMIVSVYTDELVKVLRRAIEFMGPDVVMGVDITTDGVSLIVKADVPDVGYYEDFVPITHFEGDVVTLAFNPKFLVDAFGAMKGYDETQLTLVSKHVPTLVSPKDDPEAVQVLVMPVKR